MSLVFIVITTTGLPHTCYCRHSSLLSLSIIHNNSLSFSFFNNTGYCHWGIIILLCICFCCHWSAKDRNIRWPLLAGWLEQYDVIIIVNTTSILLVIDYTIILHMPLHIVAIYTHMPYILHTQYTYTYMPLLLII